MHQKLFTFVLCNQLYSFQTDQPSLAGVSYVQLDERRNQFSVILTVKITYFYTQNNTTQRDKKVKLQCNIKLDFDVIAHGFAVQIVSERFIFNDVFDADQYFSSYSHTTICVKGSSAPFNLLFLGRLRPQPITWGLGSQTPDDFALKLKHTGSRNVLVHFSESGSQNPLRPRNFV